MSSSPKVTQAYGQSIEAKLLESKRPLEVFVHLQSSLETLLKSGASIAALKMASYLGLL